MKTIRQILKEELSKREQIRARVKEVYLERLAEGRLSIKPIKEMGFDYPGMEEDLRQVAIEWANEGIARMKAIASKLQAEAAFINMFDGLYADVWFERFTDSIFFFKGNPSSPEYWFELEDSWFWCSDDRVLKVFSEEYYLEFVDLKPLIKPLLEEAFKMRGVIPYDPVSISIKEVEETFKSRNKQ